MLPDHKDYKQACKQVLKFKKDFRIPWVRFERLDGGFNRRRWAVSVRTESARYQDLCERTIEFAKRIGHEKRALLETMGLGKRWRETQSTPFRVDSSTRVTHESCKTLQAMGLVQTNSKPTRGELTDEAMLLQIGTDPELNRKVAFNLAGRGQGNAAFHLLIDSFIRCPKLDEPSAIQLAAAVYISYRYLDPPAWRSRIGAVIQKVGQQRSQISEDVRAICLCQIAAAFLEGHDMRHAGELFVLPEVRNLTKLNEKRDNGLWNPAHSMRKLAEFDLLEGHTTRATGLVKDARQLDPSPTNNRASAMFDWLVDIRKAPADKSFSSAWQSIEREYNQFRLQFVTAAMNESNAMPDAFHMFGVMQKGAVTRCMAKEKYSKSELAEDCRAMNWYLSHLGPARVVTPSMMSWIPKLPGTLATISANCLYSPLDERSRDLLWMLAKSLA